MPRHKCDQALHGVAALSKDVKNVPASVRQRLLNLAHQRAEDFEFVRTKHALERMLFRISQSRYRDVFVLKGALLFELWTEQRYRPTRDADFLARGENSTERFKSMFKEICGVIVADDDGWRFDPDTVTAERIAENANYHGVRVKLFGYLEKARTQVQIDVGFGDSITPPPSEAEFPTLLDFPAPKLFVYSKESVVAEKFEAMIKLGIANSRMKGLYDVQSLSRKFSFAGAILAKAINETFEKRKERIPAQDMPVVFTSQFYGDEAKKKQWKAFCNKYRRYLTEESLESVCLEIAGFLTPVVEALRNKKSFDRAWSPRGRWS